MSFLLRIILCSAPGSEVNQLASTSSLMFLMKVSIKGSSIPWSNSSLQPFCIARFLMQSNSFQWGILQVLQQPKSSERIPRHCKQRIQPFAPWSNSSTHSLGLGVTFHRPLPLSFGSSQSWDCWKTSCVHVSSSQDWLYGWTMYVKWSAHPLLFDALHQAQDPFRCEVRVGSEVGPLLLLTRTQI